MSALETVVMCDDNLSGAWSFKCSWGCKRRHLHGAKPGGRCSHCPHHRDDYVLALKPSKKIAGILVRWSWDHNGLCWGLDDDRVEKFVTTMTDKHLIKAWAITGRALNAQRGYRPAKETLLHDYTVIRGEMHRRGVQEPELREVA